MEVQRKPFYAFLPDRFKKAVFTLPGEVFTRVEEIRMRSGHALAVVAGGRRINPECEGGSTVTPADIVLTLEKASGGSMYAMQGAIRRGFLTAPGGHRIGLCGTAVMRGGEITSIRDFSSLCIRVAHEIRGASGQLSNYIFDGSGRYHNTVILSPPMFGKTTVLRDLVRILSAERGLSVALCDERSEVAAMNGAVAQLDIGAADVLEGCGKATGMMMLMRSMSPDVIAVDEITELEDIIAMKNAINCGIGLLATAHADTQDDFSRRPLYRELSELNVFRRFIVLSLTEGRHAAEMFDENGRRLC